MHRACALVRPAAQVARAAAADLPSPRFLSTNPPRPRLPSPSNLSDWHTPRLRRSLHRNHQEAPILPAFRNVDNPTRPPVLAVKSRPTWNHPSFLAYLLKLSKRDPEWRKETSSYERHAVRPLPPRLLCLLMCSTC